VPRLDIKITAAITHGSDKNVIVRKFPDYVPVLLDGGN
jgi:hypothetical protein